MIARFLATKLVEARGYHEEKANMFKKLSKAMGKRRIREWNKLDTTPLIQNGSVVSVYRVKEVKCKLASDESACGIN